jgi:AcrR family transcriptional regulator
LTKKNNGVIFFMGIMMKDTSEETKRHILDSAQQEFLEKGFSGASLRTIAADAGVTTGALYRHFKDKNALFAAIVGDTVDTAGKIIRNAELRELYFLTAELPHGIKNDHQDETFKVLIDYIYDRLDILTLLLTKSSGSTYENFLQDVTDMYAGMCQALVKELRREKIIITIDCLTVHVLASCFVTSVKEIILHRIPRKKAAEFLGNIHTFYHYGWMHLFGLPCDE